jgi:hypothetical protein
MARKICGYPINAVCIQPIRKIRAVADSYECSGLLPARWTTATSRERQPMTIKTICSGARMTALAFDGIVESPVRRKSALQAHLALEKT